MEATKSSDMVEIGQLIKDFEELFLDPPFMFSELANFIESLVFIYRQNETWSDAKVEKQTLEMWEFVDDKYKLTQKFDDAVKLPAWAEPFDNHALSFIVRQLLIPTAITMYKKLNLKK